MTLRLACLLSVLSVAFASPLPAIAVPPEAVVAAASARQDAADRETGQRLDARLRGIRGLHDVTASVDGGAVVLAGEVVSEAERKLAGDIAAQMQGVEKVENRIVLSSNLSDRFESGLQAVATKLVRLLAATPLLLVAIAIVLLAAWIGRLLSRNMAWTRRFHAASFSGCVWKYMLHQVWEPPVRVDFARHGFCIM